MLGAVSRKQKKFGKRRNRFFSFEKRFTKAATERCSARLSRFDDFTPGVNQVLTEAADLRALAGAVEAFESDKHAGAVG